MSKLCEFLLKIPDELGRAKRVYFCRRSEVLNLVDGEGKQSEGGSQGGPS